MTDRDVPRATGRASLAAFWRRAIERSRHLASRVRLDQWDGQVSLFGAESGFLLPDRGVCWRAVGDASMACDPLAGNGIARALASGIQAGKEIDNELRGGQMQPSDITERFARYIARKDAYYLREQRWPAATFWMRRQPADWESAPVLIGPTDHLQLSADPSVASTAAAEALIPYPAVQSILKSLRYGLPAHEAMSHLRSECPHLPDRRLICALQMLLHRSENA